MCPGTDQITLLTLTVCENHPELYQWGQTGIVRVLCEETPYKIALLYSQNILMANTVMHTSNSSSWEAKVGVSQTEAYLGCIPNPFSKTTIGLVDWLSEQSACSKAWQPNFDPGAQIKPEGKN